MNEQLSAFLDNEASRGEADSVVNALLRDESLRESWTRQYWIRTTLRAHQAEPAVAVDADFSRRVMQAIAAAEDAAPPHALARVVPITARRRGRRWRGVAGLAAAASVAGVVFLAGTPLLRNAANDARMASTGSASGAATPTRQQGMRSETLASSGFNNRLADFGSISSATTGRLQTVATTGEATGPGASRPAAGGSSAEHWSVSDPAVRDELNGYLVDHNGMARGYGLSSTTPALVRVATYGQDIGQ